MSLTEIVVVLALVVGLMGILVPVLPGMMLILVAVLVWATDVGGSTAWVVFAVATTFLAVGTVVKYVVPGRRLKDAGIPPSTQRAGVLLGVIGFFVVPVVGLFLGFVLGVYLAERHRLGPEAAGPATAASLRAVGLSILIELMAATLAVATWVVGVAAT